MICCVGGLTSVSRAQVLVEERTAALVRALRHCEGKTVAVVDMSHLDGIEQAWQQLNETARTDRQVSACGPQPNPCLQSGFHAPLPASLPDKV